MITSRELIEFLAGALAADPRRESAPTKALRLLATGHLTVVSVQPSRILATCLGDSGDVHHLGFDVGAWSCSCPYPRDRCAHLIALRLVVTRPEGVVG